MRIGLFLSTAAVLAALLMPASVMPAYAGQIEIFQDVETGQLFTKPGKNRILLNTEETEAVSAAMPSLYQDPETGAVYAKPGDDRIPLASSARAEMPAAPAGDYSGQAFADAASNIIGERESKTYPKVKLGAEGYIGYSYDFDDEVTGEHGRNKFSLNRGYINFKPELTSEIKARITPDISRNPDGDYKLRLKYYYVDFHDFLAFYPSLSVKLGQFEGAWLDHVEHLWTYRVQGTMMVEREGFMNSANLGVNFQGKLPAGYGEWQANFVNGEGYHADENNKYKSVQARLTLHPLPGNEWTRGLELTGFYFGGKEDSLHKRDRMIAFAGYKYENDLFVGAEYLWTRGNDNFVAPAGVHNVKGGGLSVLGWYRLPFYEPIRLMARWDRFDHDTDSPDNTVNRYIYGLSYDIGKYVTVLADGERVVARSYRGGYNKKSVPDENLFKVDVLVKF